VTLVNKFSGKALEGENSSVHQGARIQKVTLTGAASQHWFVKFTKFIRCRTIPSTIGRQAQRFWAAFLRFPAAGYSLVADHSGLCLDIPNGSMDKAVAVQQFPLNGGSSHLWGFVPDDTGFYFIVNLKSGLVLDVADNSVKNYATVWQYPFNGGEKILAFCAIPLCTRFIACESFMGAILSGFQGLCVAGTTLQSMA
jgi:Ricin-type beta-trefoil lectin domain-like